MKAPQWICGCLLSFSLSIFAFAQHGGGGHSGGAASGGGVAIGGSPSTGITAGTSSLQPFISGKVALDDGTVLTEPVAIETICRGNRHTVAYSDAHGVFSFQFGDPAQLGTPDLSDASNSMLTRQENQQNQRDWKSCELDAILPGYTSEIVELASRVDALDDTDIGRITLHRMAQVEGTSISVTSALAPGSAKSALQKGREAEKKGQWDKAEQSFQKAVKIYPKYASAWYELGRVQIEKKDLAGAKHSFEQSVAADPKFVNPYDGLAQLAFQAKQWPEVIDSTNKLLALNPVNFPTAYFLNGVANYYMKNFDAAEKVVRRGTKVDETHSVPKLQYLLGMILLQKHDYAGAEVSLKQYLQLTKQPAEIAEAQKELGEVEKLSSQSAPSEVKR
ncbi:MAG TPA: tetratricopeptide repeat protein [Terriglobales bacterium]|nr:tetratricopeptide repeat protein [Terriglobales bacterium]